jgi:hypothetical protein
MGHPEVIGCRLETFPGERGNDESTTICPQVIWDFIIHTRRCTGAVTITGGCTIAAII